MAWTYSGNPSSSEVDKYRFLIGDTISSEPILQNEEIQYILTTYSSHNTRLYHLFNASTNIYARDYKKALGPQSEDPTERLNYFKSQTALYKKLNSASGLSVPGYAFPKAFVKGMHDNA